MRTKHPITGVFLFAALFILAIACKDSPDKKTEILNKDLLKDPLLVYKPYSPQPTDFTISRSDYKEKLYEFWLGQCTANWTGLVTEMDKIGGDGKNGKAAGFYTRENWGKADHPNLWDINNFSDTITYLYADKDSIWGADDDTDIEYIYQDLLYRNKTSVITAKQIRDGWLKHIRPEEENFLWVSNQTAFTLMQKGILPPHTGNPDLNKHYDMIDAQLTTEIFGFFAPTRPDIALKMAHLPIQTTARKNAEWIAEFYVIMYSLAPLADKEMPTKENLEWMATEARKRLPNGSYSAKMYDFVQEEYKSGVTWEEARDALHEKYQVKAGGWLYVGYRGDLVQWLLCCGHQFWGEYGELALWGRRYQRNYKDRHTCRLGLGQPDSHLGWSFGFYAGQRGC